MPDCPGCVERRSDDGVWHPLGPHRAGCKSVTAEIAHQQQTLDAIQQRAAVHRRAIEDGCNAECDHPLDSSAGWREYHELTLQNEEQIAQRATAGLWALVSEGAGRLDAPMTDADNILRLPAEDAEEDYWRARHEAAHVVVGLMLGRTLRHVTIEPDTDHHPDNRGSTVWLDDGPPPKNLDAVTTWAGVIAGPDRSVAEGDLEHLKEIDGCYDNYRWGALRVYRAMESTILAFAAELAERRTMTGEEAAAWLRKRMAGGKPSADE